MKIRTVTAGVRLQATQTLEEMQATTAAACAAATATADALTAAGYEVQTTRVAYSSFEDFVDVSNASAAFATLRALDETLATHKIPLAALGSARSVAAIRLCPDIVLLSSRFSVNATLAAPADAPAADAQAVRIPSGDAAVAGEIAAAVLRVARESPHGDSGNCFRFCLTSSMSSVFTPFFPASTVPADTPPNTILIAIGLENGDLLHSAWAGLPEATRRAQHDLQAAAGALRATMAAALVPVEKLCVQAVAELAEAAAAAGGAQPAVVYAGIDTSMNPALTDTGSVAYGFELLGLGAFGGPGTLAVTGMVTSVLQSLPVKTTGYCGLMLPICEDLGLARRANEGKLALDRLLMFSAVCGVGLDTVPIVGDVSAAQLQAVFLDVAAIALKWNKPLSCRLFPVPGSKVGDRTDFSNNPHMCDSTVFAV